MRLHKFLELDIPQLSEYLEGLDGDRLNTLMATQEIKVLDK